MLDQKLKAYAMFIETQETPNPATMKFLPGQAVTGDAGNTYSFVTHDDAAQSPLAAGLFDIKGVDGVFFGADFLAVTKKEGEWPHLVPKILAAIMAFYGSGAPLIADEQKALSQNVEDEFFEPQAADIVADIKELIETRVRPAVADDGGDIHFRGFSKGVVYLAMKGACAGCPSSTATLKHGIQNLLRHFIPQVTSVEQI